MIYMIPSKKGMGAELWGTYEDLDELYDFIGKYWNCENDLYQRGDDSRDKLISVLSYDIRKAKQQQRLRRANSHFSNEKQDYYGVQISWVQLLFCLTAIKYNMQYHATSKLDVSFILQLEHWLEKALITYDSIGAERLIEFIDGGLYGGNDYIYHYWYIINLNFFELGGGKRAFRKLPKLLERGIFHTSEYKAYANFLEKEAARLNCEISELGINDDHVDYDIW